MNRRRAIASLSLTVVAIGAALGIPAARRERSRRLHLEHQRSGPHPLPLDDDVATATALLIGALFGHTLEGRDLDEMRDRVRFIARMDGGWRADFGMIATYLDRRARAHGATGFDAASADVHERIVDEIMRPAIDSRRSELAALISADERTRRFIRTDAVGLFARAYSTSSAIWRRRGYARWPGIPGDPREYTRPGPAYQC
jgi:hypothetical protein